jgi:hypothetical protein
MGHDATHDGDTHCPYVILACSLYVSLYVERACNTASKYCEGKPIAAILEGESHDGAALCEIGERLEELN